MQEQKDGTSTVNTRGWTPINPPMQVIFQGKSYLARFLGDVPGNSPSYLLTPQNHGGQHVVTSIENVSNGFDQNTPITQESLDALQTSLRTSASVGAGAGSGSGNRSGSSR